MATKTCGRSSRAASTRRRSIANDRGTTRIASVSPVTEKPAKSPMRWPPAACKPVPEAEDLGVGLTLLQLRRERAGIEVADASPQEIMILIAVAGGLGPGLHDRNHRRPRGSFLKRGRTWNRAGQSESRRIGEADRAQRETNARVADQDIDRRRE